MRITLGWEIAVLQYFRRLRADVKRRHDFRTAIFEMLVELPSFLGRPNL
jgi:hypothetical protein